MSDDYTQYIPHVLAVVAAILYGEAQYWRAKFQTLDAERGRDDWQEEAEFWREWVAGERKRTIDE